MAVDLKAYESDDSTLWSAPSFSAAVPGSATSAITVHLWNHKGAGSGDTASNLRIRIKARVTGDPVYLSAGIDVLDERAFQVRVTGGNGISPVTTGWIDIGAGASFAPGIDLPYNTALHIEFRLNPSSSVETDDLDFFFDVDSSFFEVLGNGHAKKGPDGILMELGETTEVGIVRVGTVTENTVPDYDVLVDAWKWVAAGELFSLWSDTVTVGATDVNTDSLGAGEVYDALLTGRNNGTVRVTKGAKASSGSQVAPDAPVGEPILATITVNETSIQDADITVNTVPDYFGMLADFSAVGPGRAIVGDRLIERTGSSAITGLTPSVTNYVWLNRDGTITVNTSETTQPNPGSIILHGLTVNGTPEVTATTDRRRIIGPESVTIQLRIDGTNSGVLQATDASAIVANPVFGRRRAWLHPFDTGMALYLDDAGSGNSSGETSFDLEVRPAGSSFASAMDSADLAQLPQVAYDSADLFAFGHFSVFDELLAGDAIKAVCNSIPAGGTAPAAGVLVVHILAI